MTWQTLATRTASNIWSALAAGDTVTESLVAVRQLRFTHLETRDHYFLRLKAGLATPNDYANDFSTNAFAELRGTAALTNGSLRLTDAIGGQTGSAVLTGLEVWPGQSGFEASFNLALGPIAGATPADGISFSVGDLGSAAWGELGPATARHLTVSFDTYENGAGPIMAKGIRLMMGTNLIAYHNTDPYSNGTNVPVQVSFTSASGASVRFGGTQIFTNVPVPGLVLQPGDRYGFGARTGGYNEVNRVDDVVIGPQ
jgi:hypothetical protein